MYLPGTIAAIYVQQNFGLRNTLLYAGSLTTVGCMMRWGAAQAYSSSDEIDNSTVNYFIILLGTLLPALAQPIVSISLGFKGLFLYIVDILCNVEWCIRYSSDVLSIILHNISSSGVLDSCDVLSIIFYNITSIAHNHHTNISPLLNIYLS